MGYYAGDVYRSARLYRRVHRDVRRHFHHGAGDYYAAGGLFSGIGHFFHAVVHNPLVKAAITAGATAFGVPPQATEVALGILDPPAQPPDEQTSVGGNMQATAMPQAQAMNVTAHQTESGYAPDTSDDSDDDDDEG